MRFPSSLLLALAFASPAFASTPAIAPQQAAVAKASVAKLRPAYAQALLALGRSYRHAGRLAEAAKTAQQAADAFDALVELHKHLSDALPDSGRATAERHLARGFGVQRDQAMFLTAECARALGHDDDAIRAYALVVESEAELPLGRQALDRLTAMGVAASAPAAPEQP
ncbi:MAG TPA: tetratricopeptide repeat protein [Oscillatoriaceae cyanobacterium]